MAPPPGAPGVDEETARVRALYDAMVLRYGRLRILDVVIGAGRKLPTAAGQRA